MGDISAAEKGKLFVVFLGLYGIFYLIPNFLPVFEPRFLPLFPFERSLPLVPWTFLIYISDYLLMGSVIWLVKDRETWNPFVRQAFGLLMFCGLIFFFFPTTYPRPEYPEVGGLVGLLMFLVRNGDTPNNCFPSMHVAVTALGMWTMRKRSLPQVILFSVWGVAIFVSTLTTKQHYVWDIFGGLAATTVIVLADRYLFPRFSPAKAVSP